MCSFSSGLFLLFNCCGAAAAAAATALSFIGILWYGICPLYTEHVQNVRLVDVEKENKEANRKNEMRHKLWLFSYRETNDSWFCVRFFFFSSKFSGILTLSVSLKTFWCKRTKIWWKFWFFISLWVPFCKLYGGHWANLSGYCAFWPLRR